MMFGRQCWRATEPVAVAGVQLRPRNALRRVLGMQVEWQPGDLGAEPAPEPVGQRLAEPAERSDVIRPDQDLVLVGHACNVTFAPLLATTG